MTAERHRKGSIFWPLTFIGLGILFLYQNFNPDVHPWHLIAKYWPALIIFWGISKLIDYFHARAHPQQETSSLFSAGEIILLIIALAMGTILSKTLLQPQGKWPAIMGITDQQFAEMFFNSYTFTQKVSQNVVPSPHILIVNRRGNVEIHGSDQDNISGVIQETIWAENESAAREIANRLKFHLAEDDRQYALESNLGSLPHARRTLRLDMMLRVPNSATVEVTVDQGDISIKDLKGNQILRSRHGDLHASNIEGILRIHKSRGATSVQKIDGNVEVEGRGSDIAVQNVMGSVVVKGNFFGTTQFENISQRLRYNSSRTNLNLQKLTGNLSMDMGNLAAKGVGGPFELTTRDKDIALENFSYNVKIVNANGDVRLQTSIPPTHPIQVTLKKGDITLSLPGTSSFTLNALSTDGNVSCDFPGLKVSKRPRMPVIKGTYGKGGPLIQLRSTYGTIRVLRVQPGLPSPASTASSRIETERL